MAIWDATLREQVKALGWTVPKGVEMRLHVVPAGQLPGQRASITVFTEMGAAPDLSFLQEPGFSIMVQAAFERALQAAFAAGYEEGFKDRDHSADRNSEESWTYWESSDEGKSVIAQATVES